MGTNSIHIDVILKKYEYVGRKNILFKNKSLIFRQFFEFMKMSITFISHELVPAEFI